MFSRATKMPRGGNDGRAKGAPSGLSFIGPEVTVSGDVSTAAQLHVDGRVDGDVRCGVLCQGKSGTITGNIAAGQARLAGLVDGTVNAETVVLEETARVTGDVTYETISIAAGAQVEGRLSRRPGAPLKAESGPTLVATPLDSKPGAQTGGPGDLFLGAGKKSAAA